VTNADNIDRDQVWADFTDAVNMSPSDLEKWLRTDDSRKNGWKEDGGQETIGHHSGRCIVDIKHKKKAALTEEDYAHMRRLSDMSIAILRKAGPSGTKSIRHGATR